MEEVSGFNPTVTSMSFEEDSNDSFDLSLLKDRTDLFTSFDN